MEGVLNWLVEKGDDVKKLIVYRDNDEGKTPLHIAAEQGNMKAIQWLVNKKRELLTIVDKKECSKCSSTPKTLYWKLELFMEISNQLLNLS